MGLLDLPNELLLQILDLLQSELYTLALVSKRLHHLALPIYLARNGMSPFSGELILFDDRSQEVLQALSVALFRPALKRIHCTFNFCGPKKELVQNVREVVRLASKLSRIDEVHFDFIHIPVVTRGLNISDSWYKHFLAGVIGDEWEQEFLGLFSSVLETGCTTLTMCLQGKGWSVASTPDQLASAVGWKWSSWLSELFPHSVIADSFKSLKWYTSQGVDFFSMPLAATPRNVDLETFNLHSSMLLHAQFCSWTIETLNSSSISTLSLKHLCIHQEAWNIILPRITLRALSSLSIDACTIGYTELSNFLDRHPQVTRLYLGRRLMLPPSNGRLSKSALRQLTHLSATLEYLINLLSPTNSLPNLKNVVLMVRIRRGYYFDFVGIDNALSSISHRLRQVNFSLELSLESSMNDWMFHEISPERQGAKSVLLHVTNMCVNLRTYDLPRDVMMSFPRWLSCFPGLKQTSITTPTQIPPTDLLLLHPFFRSIKKLCPRIETVEISGHIYDVEIHL